jgi:hypothetical protein
MGERWTLSHEPEREHATLGLALNLAQHRIERRQSDTLDVLRDGVPYCRVERRGSDVLTWPLVSGGSDMFAESDPEARADWRETFEAIPETNGQTRLYFDTPTDTAPGLEDVERATEQARKEIER